MRPPYDPGHVESVTQHTASHVVARCSCRTTGTGWAGTISDPIPLAEPGAARALIDAFNAHRETYVGVPA